VLGPSRATSLCEAPGAAGDPGLTCDSMPLALDQQRPLRVLPNLEPTMDKQTNPTQTMTPMEWRLLPEDVKAGVFEEIEELRERGGAEQHWAWEFVRSFYDDA